MVTLTVTAGEEELVGGAIVESAVEVELEESTGEVGPSSVLAKTKVGCNGRKRRAIGVVVLEEPGICLFSSNQ